MLFGLAGAAIPVILHLLNLRKLRTIEFSTLTFLKELQTTKIRRLKLRQFLLLLLRTMIVVAIVLAFARPAMKGNIVGSVGTRAKTTAVIFFDNSLSMSARNAEGELLKQGKEFALHVVDLMKEGDEAFLIRSSEFPSPLTETPLHDKTMLKTLIRETEYSQRSYSFDEGFSLTKQLLDKSQNTNKEVYIFSDFQKTSWRSKKESTQKLFGENVRIFVSRFVTEQSNSSIDTVLVQTKIIEQNKPLNVSVTVKNFGAQKIDDAAVSIFFNEKRVAQKNLSLETWGSSTEIFSIVPNLSGWINGYAELESDALDEDNRKYFSFYVPEKISVCFVSESEKDIQFPLLALNTSEDSTRSLFDIQTIFHSQLSRINLNNVDVLVLSNMSLISKEDAGQILSFTQRGGGVLFFPGDKSDIVNINSTFNSTFNIPPVQAILRGQNNSVVSTVENIDYNHPLFSGVFENEKTKQSQKVFESPEIYSLLQRTTGKEGATIISVVNNFPLLSEYKIGNGKLLVYSIAPTLEWSNIPLKGIFVPLIHRSVLYCAIGAENASSFIVGDEPQIRLSNKKVLDANSSQNTKQYSIISNDSSEEIIEGVKDIHKSIVKTVISKREKAGNFLVKANRSPVGMFSVNIDSRESDLRSIEESELNQFYVSSGIDPTSVYQLQNIERVESSIMQSRYGVELWKFFIICAIVFALLEMILGRTGRKETEVSMV